MLDTEFSLSWEQHKHNISYGLSKFQKSGEFVDMTLAVDGYFVKVHQMILSLVSPYIKDIIMSLECSHPVLFLNNVSYKTLCSILDYIYQGEVQVSKEQLEDLIQAGKQLQIKGLQEMNHNTMSSNIQAKETSSSNKTGIKLSLPQYVKQDVLKDNEEQVYIMVTDNDTKTKDKYLIEVQTEETKYTNNTEDEKITCISAQSLTKNEILNIDSDNCSISTKNKKSLSTPYFTTSNQGSPQLVVGEYMYCLRYSSSGASKHCQWKCLNYSNTKCPAFVVTRDDRVLQRVTIHTHPPHDLKIAKKITSGELYSTMKGAEVYAQTKKEENSIRNKRKTSFQNLSC